MFDICVIGLGRVGLPLALTLENKGFKVCGIDNNKTILQQLCETRMPFKEPGCQNLLENSKLLVSGDYKYIKESKTIIITVGTPILADDEINYNHIKSVIDEVLKNYSEGMHIILRSTIAPSTSVKLINYISKQLDISLETDFLFSYCPERLVEGQAIKELGTLPQIIGCADKTSYEASIKIFEKVTTGKLIESSFVEAELSKIFLNASRYAYFSIINYLCIMSELYNVDIYKLLEIANTDYPRKILGTPGFTSGTCLKKDYKMISTGHPFCDLFENVNKINQSIPNFLIAIITSKVCVIEDLNIGILGYSFKSDSDDTRDSLSIKLIRCVENIFPNKIMINDEYVHIDNFNEEHQQYYCGLEQLFKESDIIIIATNHSEYKNDYYLNKFKDKMIVDIWNVTGKNKIFQLDLLEDENI